MVFDSFRSGFAHAAQPAIRPDRDRFSVLYPGGRRSPDSSLAKRIRVHFCRATTIGSGTFGASMPHGAPVCLTATCPAVGTDALRDFSVENALQGVLCSSFDEVSAVEPNLAGTGAMAGNS